MLGPDAELQARPGALPVDRPSWTRKWCDQLAPDDALRIAELGAGDARRAGQAVSLLNRELGEGLYLVDYLLDDAANPGAAVLLAEQPQLLGAAVSRLLAAADAAYYDRFGAELRRLFAHRVGSLEALAVEPAFRRRSTGSLLARASLEWMVAKGCETAVTLAWESGKESASAPLFRRLAFREGPTVERFYLEESLREGWACPVCGVGCRCSATLYTLPLIAGR
jgi:ribosomal protein S18 acetylase RimI-like enzyme